ncbi:ABC transporter ATP-binding protein (plasmid) [Clostridium butyricum]|uniref:ABC transporter ATP-binding protein n=1 Tax=Clostridium butyricum TaxID=1492 RepID=UPI003D11D5A3
MLKLENISFKYPGQKENTLNDISLEINEGTFLAIVGSNGSGKSTMCKLFNGIIPNFFVGDLEGNIFVDDIDTSKSNVAKLSSKVGYVYQDFENSIVRPSVFDEVSFAALNYGIDDYKERALEALKILDLEYLKDEYIWQLSGGQKHLVALASVVATKPKYIIIDEPVAQLDPHHARQTYEKLKVLNEEHGVTIIVIEHHTEFIADYCKEVVLLNKGRILWKKSVKAALNSVNDLMASNIFPPQVTQVAYALSKSETGNLPICLNEAEIFFEKIKSNTGSLRENQLYTEKEETVAFNDVIAGYKDYSKNNKIVIDNINLKLLEDERIAIVGNNGAGKSTILKLISKLIKPSDGNVRIRNKDIADKSPEEVCNSVSYINQNPEEMFIDDSIEKDVAYFLKARKRENYEKIVEQILKELGLFEMKEKDPRLLSGGQQRRVSLAIGMGMTPEIILLDEPTASLDISSRKELLKILKLLNKYIKTSIVATHDMQLVADWASRVIVVNKGKIIFDGTPQSLFKRKDILNIANLVPPQIVELSRILGLEEISLRVDDILNYINITEENNYEAS